MRNFFGQHEALSSPAALTARVLVDAKRKFGVVVDLAVRDRCAQHAVSDLWRETIRVKTFVPVLAKRRIRDMLERRGRRGRRPPNWLGSRSTAASPLPRSRARRPIEPGSGG